MPPPERADGTRFGVRFGTDVFRAPARLGRVRVLAIDGPSGSGKSTLAHEIRNGLISADIDTALLSTDDFATWNVPVAWWPRFVQGVRDRLAVDAPGHYRKMEWPGGVPRLGAWTTVPVPEVLVFEGVSAGRAAMRPFLSRLCWVEEPNPEVRLARAVARDGAATSPHLAAWQRFEAGWFPVDQTREHADALISPATEAGETRWDLLPRPDALPGQRAR